MAYQNCSSCSDLKEYAPDFVANGVTKSVCTSLKNNTGLGTNADHNDCDDLDDANDCLIGGLGSEIEAYDTCNWKDFMKKFVPNIYNMFKAIICTLCGIWTNIKSILKRLTQAECEIKYLYNGASFSIGEEPTDGSYIVAGKGVSFYLPHGGSAHTNDVALQYIAGGLCRLYGTCKFLSSDFTDAETCVNFDNGTTERSTKSRKGNSVWGSTGRPASGGELVFEVRIKKSEYPQVKQFFKGFGINSNTGVFQVQAHIFGSGSYAYGQHGWCESDGSPSDTGYDGGHLVPDGFVYIQCRMHHITSMLPGYNYTPYMFLGMRTNRDEIDC